MSLSLIEKYVHTFTNQTSVTVRGTVHRLGTSDIMVQVLTGDRKRTQGEWSKLEIDSQTCDVTVTFETETSARLVLWG